MSERRPTALTPIWENLPRDLLRLHQWVCWRYELDGKKWTKVPYQADGRPADSTRPSTWSDFNAARSAYESGQHGFDGIGTVFSEDDDYAGVDLDGCIDAKENVAPEAMVIIRRLNSYTEVSPSGTGVKIWLKGRLPDKCRHSTTRMAGFKKIEFYDRGRYFAVTGRHLPGTPTTIEPRHEELLALHDEIFAEAGAPGVESSWAIPAVLPDGVGFPGTDNELIERARQGRNGQKFVSLFDGGDVSPYGGDDSGADLALCNIAAWWSGPDPPRIERLVSMSALGQRVKWKTRPDYRERTIARALRGRTQFYEHAAPRQPRPRRASTAPSNAGTSGTAEEPMEPPRVALPTPKLTFAPVAAADLIDEHPDLRQSMLAGLLRKGEVMNLVAAPKVGKTWMVHSLAMAFAAGKPWLGMPTAGGRVLLIDGELHEETLANRLAKIGCSDGVCVGVLGDRLEVWPVRGQRLSVDDIGDSLWNVEAGSYQLIVIDALYRFLPIDGEENSNETMTQVYNALDALARRTGAAVVVVHHSTKGSQAGKAVTDVGAGGSAQARAADTHLVLRPHEEEGAIVVEAAVRSWKRLEPFVIRWQDPGWALAPDLDPKDLALPPARKKKVERDDSPVTPVRTWTPEQFASEFAGPTAAIKDDIIARAREAGLSMTQAESLLKRALDAAHIHRHTVGPSVPHRFSTQPPDHTLKLVGGPGEGGGRAPSPPEPSARGGVGGPRTPPPPLLRLRHQHQERRQSAAESVWPSQNRPRFPAPACRPVMVTPVPKHRRKGPWLMGSLYQRDGKWGIDYRDHRGRRVRTMVSSDKRVAARALADAEGAVDKLKVGIFQADPREAQRPLAEHFEAYLGEMKRRGRDGLYTYIVGKRLEMAGFDRDWASLRDCTHTSIGAYLKGIADDGRIPKTVNSHRADLSAFFAWCVQQGYLESNPCDRVAKIAVSRDKRRRALSVEECRRLLATAPPHRRICYHFLLYSGLRRAEAGAIRWANVRLDVANPHVELPGAITKSGRPETVPLVPELADALAAHRGDAQDRQAVFESIPSMPEFRSDLAAAGIADQDERGRKVVLHSLRHSLATMLAQSKVPPAVAMTIMRHRDIRLTLEVYTDEGLLPTAAAMGALPSLVAPTEPNHAERRRA